ncbi:cyclase family protein [candidate division WWE3 bacterium]|uniref:Kynurenine formamidase n=1 Tax=candidate division WWE3 bacterium TaxID=2053526 RepID=A0A955LGM7_UNCKA|nr:cyclase family protein [candidate division WWE3 bacterium]
MNLEQLDPKKIIDVSAPIFPGMVLYPGSHEVVFNSSRYQDTTSTTITFDSHTGTHFDAPAHAFENGRGVDTVSLSSCIGVCRVLDLTSVEEKIMVADLEPFNIISGERLLFKTQNSVDTWETFNESFIYIDGDAADYLAEKQVALVGVDYLSVKKFHGPDIRPHNSLLSKEIVIIEGLILKNVVPKKYDLIALPLKLKNLDGSPSRVILIDNY